MAGFTLRADTLEAIQKEAARTGAPVSHVADAALRRGLGLPEVPTEATA
jgi:hypothetical protein